MIESEEMRQVIEEDIERWCNLVKATPLLRARDISSLADTILQEFYHICLCCGHWVKEMDEGINLEIDTPEGKEYGSFCTECAKEYISAGFAREVKSEIPL